MKKATKKSKTTKPSKTLVFGLIAAVVSVALDQWSKYEVIKTIKPIGFKNLIEVNGAQILNFTYVENRGASFGIFQGQIPLLSIITGLFLIFALYLLIRKIINEKAQIWALCMLIGGGAGNLIDRIARGYVV
ncbi:MAG: signal peptidase II, partial [Oscillospiraceae bacterium]|nr:signal peptidase II [Oscillospiraceae bacterium]